MSMRYGKKQWQKGEKFKVIIFMIGCAILYIVVFLAFGYGMSQ